MIDTISGNMTGVLLISRARVAKTKRRNESFIYVFVYFFTRCFAFQIGLDMSRDLSDKYPKLPTTSE